MGRIQPRKVLEGEHSRQQEKVQSSQGPQDGWSGERQGDSVGEKGENVDSGGPSKCNEKLVESFKQGSDRVQFHGLLGCRSHSESQ